VNDIRPRFRAAQLVLALRQAGVRDPRVMEALEKTPRDLFVPTPFRDSAWENFDLPIDCGQTMTRPVTVGAMIEQLDIRREHNVLDIGTGSGFPAAVMARLARRVTSIDRYRTLLERARQTLEHLGVLRVELKLADGLKGFADSAPYDRVLVTGGMSALPKALVDQLAPNAIVLAPIQRDGVTHVTRLNRSPDGTVHETQLFRGLFIPLQPGLAKEL
jgi:protein-L-isoaspartate(D-aspartate) O-methyltransferase